jgi:hypothetical protein
MIELNLPTPTLGLKVTVNFFSDLGPMVVTLGSMVKQEFLLSSGSIAEKSNLNGYLPLSKLVF